MSIQFKQIEGFDNINVQSSGSREELYYTDNFGDTIQLTYSGSIGGQNLSPASGSDNPAGDTFDGCPVYRKYFSGSALPAGYLLETNVRDVIFCGGWIKHDSTFVKYLVPHFYSTIQYFYLQVLDNNDLVAQRGTTYDQYEYNFYVDYTKV
ncbi:MAG: hypothetical protein FK734_10675 [Asgard group archaeon]|nr:hypothetical protein [Asgard group archaeon]